MSLNSTPAIMVNSSQIIFSNNNLCVLFDNLQAIIERSELHKSSMGKRLVAAGWGLLSLSLLSRRDKSEQNETSFF